MASDKSLEVLSQASIVFSELSNGIIDIRSYGIGNMEDYADASLSLIKTALAEHEIACQQSPIHDNRGDKSGE